MGNQQIFDHEIRRYYDAPPYPDSNIMVRPKENQMHPMQNQGTYQVQNQQMPGNPNQRHYQEQLQAYNENKNANPTDPSDNQPKEPVMAILSMPERYQECGPQTDNKATAVRIRIPVGTTKPWVEFMIDNGATVNLITASVLDDDMPICTADARELGGITNQTVKTYVSIYLDIKGTPVKFQIVSNDFLIPFDGMLRRNYLKKEEAVISYYKNALMISGYVMHPIPFIEHEKEHNPKNLRKGYKC
ncbi:hypothetical protein TSAR_002157 [Trichomalopsis sarcophagae]|uniref:Peptidase A2 domain-containing protein n=1 Tax=Trichomalopsis sarcophagae TaxID=543379 RepID=A0A232EIM6_9HYME|nr:hypothetical protein TSAR_002157 [Trichomalopsis sarcophagae]